MEEEGTLREREREGRRERRWAAYESSKQAVYEIDLYIYKLGKYAIIV